MAADIYNCTNTTAIVLSTDLLQELGVIRRSETPREKEHLLAGLVERVLELARFVGGIDVHQNRPDPRRGVLHHHPLEAVRRPDPNAISLLNPAGEERLGELRSNIPELAVARTVCL